MQIDRRVTNGLAWAGVLLVVGIPAADLVSAQFMGGDSPAAPAQIAVVEPVEPVAPVPAPLSQRPAEPVAVAAVEPKPAVVPEPVEVAAVTPAPQPAPVVTKPATPSAAQTADAVDAFLQSGKELPSYITGAPSAAPKPTQTATTPSARPIITTEPTDPVQVASIPAKVAPTPMPLSMRPQSVAVPIAVMPPSNEPLILPNANGPVPPVDVTARDLEEWETGPLSDFLASRQQPRRAEPDPRYDQDGFFLDEGPNQPRRGDRVLGPADGYFFPFD